MAEDAPGLRRAFGLAPTASVILRGVGSDRCLERYWEYRRQDAVPEQMARLGLSLVVGPNFSHFLDVPGTERMSNRKRQLLCLDEMMRAGLSPVPHLNAVQPGEWRFWREYSRQPGDPFRRGRVRDGQQERQPGAQGDRPPDRHPGRPRSPAASARHRRHAVRGVTRGAIRQATLPRQHALREGLHRQILVFKRCPNLEDQSDSRRRGRRGDPRPQPGRLLLLDRPAVGDQRREGKVAPSGSSEAGSHSVTATQRARPAAPRTDVVSRDRGGECQQPR